MSEDQKVPDRNHALNVIAGDLSELYGWLKLTTRYAAAHEALAVVERELGLPVGEDLFPATVLAELVPTGDTAAVLAGLVEEMDQLADELQKRSMCADMFAYRAEQAAGVRQARSIVWAAQQKAATGARAAGSSDEAIERAAQAAAAAGPGWPWDELSESGKDEQRAVARAVLAAAPPTPSAPVEAEAEALKDILEIASTDCDNGLALFEIASIADRVLKTHRAAGGGPHHGYTCAENEALTDGLQGDVNTVSDVLVRRGHKVDLREHGIDHWVWEALEKPAAPPTPSAHGVAELLGECDRLDRRRAPVVGGYLPAIVTTDEIRRLLAPGGADGDES